jgi:hypothetical protein
MLLLASDLRTSGAPPSSQNSLWQICGMDGILDITELAQERRTRYADQVANGATIMADLVC